MPDKIASDFRAERHLAVTPEVAGWPQLTFRSYGFPAGRPIDGESVDDEVCMMLLAGTATVAVGDQTWSLDRGAEAFTGSPQCLYLPPRHTYLFTPLTDCAVAYARWPARGAYPPRFIAPETVEVDERGHGAGAYRVAQVLRPGEAEHLLCTEILVPPGHWCEDIPVAPAVVGNGRVVVPWAVCYYRFTPASGWALQRRYTEDGTLDEALVIHHGDAVMLREGRYPLATAPGYGLYCLQIGAVVDA